MRQKNTGYKDVCQAYTEILVIRLMRSTALAVLTEPVPAAGNRQCASVRRYIDLHFKEPLTLEQLALVHVPDRPAAGLLLPELFLPVLPPFPGRQGQELYIAGLAEYAIGNRDAAGDGENRDTVYHLCEAYSKDPRLEVNPYLSDVVFHLEQAWGNDISQHGEEA